MDVFSAGEIAQAAGVPDGARPGAGRRRARSSVLADSARLLRARSGVAAVRALRADGGRSAALLFDKPEFAHASPGMPIAVSSAFHAGMAARSS